MRISGKNFGKAAGDYGRFRAGFPDSLFDRVASFGVGLKGQTVVDLGTGTGALARGFARRGCRVVGVDADARMIAEAKQLDAEAGVSIPYCRARAENTALEDHCAAVVAAGTCWHWFDRAQATAEARRILTPGGRLFIAHLDWLPVPGNVVEATEKLIEHYNPNWTFGGLTGMYPQWLPGLTQAGMKNIETFSYDVDVAYTPQAWRGRIRASAGIVALDPNALRTFDAALAGLLAKRFARDDLIPVPHRVFAIIAKSP